MGQTTVTGGGGLTLCCFKLSAFLISQKPLLSHVIKNSDWDDSIEFDPGTYKDHPLSQRIQHGLTLDRSSDHSTAHFGPFMASEGFSIVRFDIMSYMFQRSRFWQTKRIVNARIADLNNIHKQMIELLEPVLLDLLGDIQPTAKDWKSLSEKGEKQARRTEEAYPHVVHPLNGGVKVIVRKADGTCTVFPQKIARRGSSDGRSKEITTNYSSPSRGSRGFDFKVFADEAYIRRQQRFWEGALLILSKWLERGNRIRPEKQWLVYHIVNNDIALHVLFDNLSVECETRWFANLSDRTRHKITGMPEGKHKALLSSEDDILLYAKASIAYAQHAYTMSDAEKAVNELERFATNFGEKIPGSLKRYMIPRPKMIERIRDLIIETSAELKTQYLDDRWNLLCDALSCACRKAARDSPEPEQHMPPNENPRSRR